MAEEKSGHKHTRRVPPNGKDDGHQDGYEGWKALLLRWSNGIIVANMHNACVALEQDPQWRGMLRLNEFAGEAEADAASPLGRILSWKEEHTREVARWLQRHGINTGVRTTQEAIALVAAQRRYHPVRDYFASLRWDGTRRLHSWLKDIMNAGSESKETESYISEAGACWMRSAVARILWPGCKVDHMLIFDGDQGIRKSTVLEIIASSPWFLSGLRDFHSTDTLMRAHKAWIVEIDELSAFRSSTLEMIKSFITTKTDVFRKPYALLPEPHSRQFVLAGTTNNQEYLADATGNRRFWPVTVKAPFQLETLHKMRDQLIAEAIHDVQKGVKWYFDDDRIIGYAAEEQDQRLEADIWEDDIIAFEEKHKWEPLSAAMVAKGLELPAAQQNRSAEMRITAVLKKLGRKRVKDSKRPRMWERDWDEVGGRPGTPGLGIPLKTQETDPD